MLKLLTAKAPGLLALMGVEDEEDLALLLLFWALAKMGAHSDWREIARVN